MTQTGSWVGRRRGDHNRLGFAVQLGTVRCLGTFLADPLEVPWAAVEYLGRQLGIDDVSVVKRYCERDKTPLEHSWEIGQVYGYADFSAGQDGEARAGELSSVDLVNYNSATSATVVWLEAPLRYISSRAPALASASPHT